MECNTLIHDEHYQALLAKRKKVLWPLFWLTLGVYFAFILSVAFMPETLGKPIGDGVVSIGIVLGIALILFNFLITLIYVRFANKHIEPLIAHIHAKAGDA